jgi:hypothetical protein
MLLSQNKVVLIKIRKIKISKFGKKKEIFKELQIK